MKNPLNFFATISLVVGLLLFSSCDQEETLTELQEIDTVESIDSKSINQRLVASREIPYANDSGGRVIVSIIVDDTDLIFEARRSNRNGGNRQTFRFFNMMVNGESMLNRGSRYSIFTEGSDIITQIRYVGVRTQDGTPVLSIDSFSADILYRLIDRFNPSSRPITVAVPPTRFNLSAALE